MLVREDMAKFGLSKKHKKDPRIWTIVAVSFLKKWGGYRTVRTRMPANGC